MDKQIDAVLGWLDLPPDQRPGPIRLHFSLVNTMGHLYGPDSPQVNAAIRKEDAALSRFGGGAEAPQAV